MDKRWVDELASKIAAARYAEMNVFLELALTAIREAYARGRKDVIGDCDERPEDP